MGLFGLSKKERVIWNMIKPGNKAEVSLYAEPNERYLTSVREIDDSRISIGTPSTGTAFLEVPRGTRINVEVQIYNPITGKICFISKIVHQEWVKNRFINISCPKRLSWVQLRKFFRIETIMDAEFSLISRADTSNSLDLGYPVLFTLIRNISEGGALLIIDRKMFTDRFRDMDIIMRFKLPTGYVVRVRARIVHAAALPAGEKYGVGVEFIKIATQDREELRKFVFTKSKSNYSI